MTKDKQIEEMARAINNSDILCHTCGESTYTYCADAIAELLYNAGYRKAEDVAREIFEEIDALCEKYPTVRTLGGKTFAELKKKYESEGADDETPNN